MALSNADRELVEAELDREPTPTEAALFENLWSEHCAYRSSRPLLSAFDASGEQVVLGPGDDAAVVALPSDDGDGTDGDGEDTSDGGHDAEWYLTLGIESHNHPSYVDPYDGAATGVGGIVRDTLSMGAYPIALADCLYFGAFEREHSKYLFDGVVEGISDYANAIGVPTVTGSATFHPDFEGNPLVNVACVGLLPADRLLTAVAQEAGNRLVLLGNATGRDGLGGASFASEDLGADAETEDRPAVQVGDPYTEKLLIEANEALCAEGLIESARDLGAAGLGGASSELVAKGDLGAEIDLGAVHQREPDMHPTEILLAESQERMCYEVAPENVGRVRELAERFELGCSVIGEVTEGRYVCAYESEEVVALPAEFLAEGAPAYDRPRDTSDTPEEPERELPATALEDAFETVISSPNTASKEWVYRQYDQEVGLRTRVGPGDDAALLAMREASGRSASGAQGGEKGLDLAFAAGAEPNWTGCAPYEGARAIVLEVATNLAVKGTTPLAAVDCLNGGNPENPEVFDGFAASVSGLAESCQELSIPVVGGNVSLYNDSATGPIPPTPTLAMVGTTTRDAPPTEFQGEGVVMVVGGVPVDNGKSAGPRLGGSEYLARFGGSDRFPALPSDLAERTDLLAELAGRDGTLAAHDVSHGGLAVTLAEMVSERAGLTASIDGANGADSTEGTDEAAALLFEEAPGRAVIETTEPERVCEIAAGRMPVCEIGRATDGGRLDLVVGEEELSVSAASIAELRDTIADELN
ncbi:phosphoribosylformylglycinamidine synthase subunit PurL [Halobacteriales archaeon QS_3_64_16]|nr:MAG: phosphoribosylformylglycinamidine synthase subunit PurL [Halobacteriales archaeon QS_3_64_16]